MHLSQGLLRGYKHLADALCYVCDEIIKTRTKKYSVATSAKMYKAYKAYFSMPVGGSRQTLGTSFHQWTMQLNSRR